MHGRSAVTFVVGQEQKQEQEKVSEYDGDGTSSVTRIMIFIRKLANMVTKTFPIHRHLPRRLLSPIRMTRKQ